MVRLSANSFYIQLQQQEEEVFREMFENRSFSNSAESCFHGKGWEVSVNVMNYTGHTLLCRSSVLCREKLVMSVDQTMRRIPDVLLSATHAHQQVSAACINQSLRLQRHSRK